MKLRLRSKKGMTLVELIISMTIMVLVVGAASVIFFLTLDNWNDGSSDTRSHQDAALAETWIHNYSDTTTVVQQIQYDGIKFINNPAPYPMPVADDIFLSYVDNHFLIKKIQLFDWGEGFFETRPGPTIMELNGITKVSCSLSHTASGNYFLQYTLYTADGYTLSNGLILNNMSDQNLSSFDRTYTFEDYILEPGSNNALLLSFQ